MESVTEKPEPKGSPPSIPINQVLAAAKDADLKRLLRAKATATSRVLRAMEEEVEAVEAIIAYVAEKYPTGAPVDATPEPA